MASIDDTNYYKNKINFVNKKSQSRWNMITSY